MALDLLAGLCHPAYMQNDELRVKPRLIDRLLADAGRGGLHAVMAAGRDAGQTWRDIAADISAATGVRVSHMSLITWDREARAAAETAA